VHNGPHDTPVICNIEIQWQLDLKGLVCLGILTNAEETMNPFTDILGFHAGGLADLRFWLLVGSIGIALSTWPLTPHSARFDTGGCG
jgi:hypothetical protein